MKLWKERYNFLFFELRYCFPGLGLGAVTCLPQYISDEILQNVAETLANEVTPAQLAQGKIFPELRYAYFLV